MDYDEIDENTTVTRLEALEEVTDNLGESSEEEFLSDLGDHEEYYATDVLDWLGY
jgi:hypothetical protein